MLWNTQELTNMKLQSKHILQKLGDYKAVSQVIALMKIGESLIP
jgi:hypothetical protein